VYPIRITNHLAPNHQLIADSVINSPTIPDKKTTSLLLKKLQWLEVIEKTSMFSFDLKHPSFACKYETQS